jgi:hypothetical protein
MGIDARGWGDTGPASKGSQSNEQAGVFWETHPVNLSYAKIERLMNPGWIISVWIQSLMFSVEDQGGEALVLPG